MTSRKNVKFKFDKLKSETAEIDGLEVSIGKLIREKWDEPYGPTPSPSLATLREWDLKLLKRYKPFYLPYCDVCCLCTMGKCDLTAGKRGACGLDICAQQSRIVLIACCMGAATHIGHARHLVEHLIEKYGRDSPIDVGRSVGVDIEAPVTRLVYGEKPETLGDLEEVLDYVEKQVTQLLASTHTGQEGDNLDFESKVFHAGMIDQVGMEIADLAQISVYGFPKADPEAPLVELGIGVIDTTKPTILVIGHNVPPSVEIINYMEESGLSDSIEVAGICCTSIDATRYNPKAKIVGPISWQLRFIRSGMADVIVVDEQCIRTDVAIEAQKTMTPVIATAEKNCLGLPNRTNDPVDEIVKDLVEGKAHGALIFDPDKVGEVAVRTATLLAPKRKKFKVIPEISEILEGASKCAQCRFAPCMRACPNNLPIREAMEQAAKGDLEGLSNLYEVCIGCVRCESACTNDLPIHNYIVGASIKKMMEEKYKIRSGRGPIQDVEIRKVGGPIVLGEIPGVIALVGCANYPKGGNEVAEIAEEFAKRRFIVTTSGCSAMSIGMYRDEDGRNLYEVYPGEFDAGGIVNVGSCVANPHIAGAAIKIASIFARRKLRGNYEEIADYIHNRVGAVGIAWGAITQKAASIASGFWRLGIPVIVGPHGSKYRRMLLGRKDRKEDWYVYDARTGEKVFVGPCPEHLFYTAETKEEAMVMAAKLCMRPNDTARGRMIKLAHYIDLHKRFYKVMPDDIHLFVRTETDLPITMKEEIKKILAEKGWKENIIPDPTLLPRMVHTKEEKSDE
ncbi:MAG: CO dehydrogenase/acetyl-CoA synthase complex subunit alpha [Candidatus Methylarchaceae archaeon HK02M2]|nr:CO dehydrogenase/acetyl-CoA synthase complex subunit alpha [Candidatus Methylarchaceae archaeon HK02M2]